MSEFFLYLRGVVNRLDPTKYINRSQQDRQCTYDVTPRRVRTTVAVEKQLSITYAALVIQHAKSMRRITLSSMACVALTHFSTLSHKRLDFVNKTVTEHKTIFSTSFV